MNDLLEHLAIIELKLHGLLYDIKNIKEKIAEQNQTKRKSAASKASSASASSTAPTFFDACTADDPPRELTKYEQCPHN